MSIFKKLSLVAAALTFAGCAATSSQNAGDDYYADDYGIETPAKKTAREEKKTETAEKSVQKQAMTRPEPQSNQIVTEISKRVTAIDGKLSQIKENIQKNKDLARSLKDKNVEEASSYYEYVAKIQARLQIGTTPGNPELMEMWRSAAVLLTTMDKNIAETAKISSESVRLKNEIDSLLNTVRETFQLPGAVEADHENLKALEDDANQTVVGVNRLSTDLAAQINRLQQSYNTEKQRLNALENDIQTGASQSMNTVTAIKTAAPIATPRPARPLIIAAPSLPDAEIRGRRPLMVIRFDRPNISYDQQLYKAAKLALEKRPRTSFELVAVSDDANEQDAFQNAEAVKASLLAMNVPENRIFMSKIIKSAVSATEVQLFLK